MALLKNTRASIQLHRRFFIFLAILLIAMIALVAAYSIVPQDLTAGKIADPTPTPTPSGDANIGNYTVMPTPEYGLGGAIIAMLACFIGFAVFTRYQKRVR